MDPFAVIETPEATFTRTIGAGAGQIQWLGAGGFGSRDAAGQKLTVTLTVLLAAQVLPAGATEFTFDGQGFGHGIGMSQYGAKGMAAWGLWLPVWMKASWFKKHGYQGVDRSGPRELVWKPFVADAEARESVLRVRAGVHTLDEAKQRAAQFIDESVIRGKDSSGGPIITNFAYLKENLDRLLTF